MGRRRRGESQTWLKEWSKREESKMWSKIGGEVIERGIDDVVEGQRRRRDRRAEAKPTVGGEVGSVF